MTVTTHATTHAGTGVTSGDSPGVAQHAVPAHAKPPVTGAAMVGTALGGTALGGTALGGTALVGTAVDLVGRSRSSLVAACLAGSVSERYVEAHLGALRAAAALLAARSKPARRPRLRSVWEVLPQVAPELAEWAVFFTASGRRRLAVERGAVLPSTREADDLLRQAELFLEQVQTILGLPVDPTLPVLAAVRVGST